MKLEIEDDDEEEVEDTGRIFNEKGICIEQYGPEGKVTMESPLVKCDLA